MGSYKGCGVFVKVRVVVVCAIEVECQGWFERLAWGVTRVVGFS